MMRKKVFLGIVLIVSVFNYNISAFAETSLEANEIIPEIYQLRTTVETNEEFREVVNIVANAVIESAKIAAEQKIKAAEIMAESIVKASESFGVEAAKTAAEKKIEATKEVIGEVEKLKPLLCILFCLYVARTMVSGLNS